LNIPDGARGHINRQPQIRVFGQIVKSVPKALTLNKVQAQLGTRWFDLFPNSDFVDEIGYESEQLLFAAQLEHNFGLSDWSIGATVNSTTRQASIIFGIKFDVGKKAEVFTSTPKILQSSENNSLKALRRSSLSSLWRKNVQITQKPFLKEHK
jgi:hypothetical protein